MNKIVLAQINTIAGNINYNTQKIRQSIEKAKEVNADLIIFPKNALIGHPIGDIAKRHKSITDKRDCALNEIANSFSDITIVLENAVINGGKIFHISSFALNGEKFAFELSKDVDTVIIPANQQTRAGAEYERNLKLSNIAKEYGVNCIFVNQVGYADNIVFDGLSRIYNKNGELTLRAKCFEEDLVFVQNYVGEIQPMPNGMEKQLDINNFDMNYSDDLERTYKSCVFAIKEYFAKNGFKKAVLGLSGGLDSTISVVLLVDALGRENVYGVSMPSKITSQGSKDDARILAENLGISFQEIPLADAIDPMKEILDYAFVFVEAEKYEKSTTIENLQARTRATILWSIANEHKNMLPIATSDKSEAYIGYATVNGDMSGGFAPLLDITKTKLFALGHFMNEYREQKNVIPQAILEKPPGAELKINPETGNPVYAEEDNMPYPFLDEIIWLVEKFGYGFDELLNHKFYFEQKQEVSYEQKKEWINKFFWKQHCAVFKWHIIPPSIIVDTHSINSVEYRQPIISKIF
ncbi:MAG: NAD(+) synthase [Cyanobacteria bacterium SIG29]|nr:NAD(+) synthase [Cyanobacteria bacterium SIG29]